MFQQVLFSFLRLPDCEEVWERAPKGCRARVVEQLARLTVEAALRQASLSDEDATDGGQDYERSEEIHDIDRF